MCEYVSVYRFHFIQFFFVAVQVNQSINVCALHQQYKHDFGKKKNKTKMQFVYLMKACDLLRDFFIEK